MDDMELMNSVVAGDMAAKRELVMRLGGRIRATVFYLAGERPDAEDLVQDVLFEILKAAPGFLGSSSIETWATTIAVRTTKNRLKASWRREKTEKLQAEEIGVSGDNPVNNLLARAQNERVAQLLWKIKTKQRLCLVLKLVNGYKVSEVSEITGMPVNTVRGHLRRGRVALRNLVLMDPVLRETAHGREA